MPRFKASFNSLTGEHSIELDRNHFMTMAHRDTAHRLARILNDLDDLVAEMNEPVGPYENRSEVNRVKAAYAVCKALGLGHRLDIVGRGSGAGSDEGGRHAVG